MVASIKGMISGRVGVVDDDRMTANLWAVECAHLLLLIKLSVPTCCGSKVLRECKPPLRLSIPCIYIELVTVHYFGIYTCD